MSCLGPGPLFILNPEGTGSVPVPYPYSCFQPAQLPRATITFPEPVHPGQRIKVAEGLIEISGEAFDGEVPPLEITGWAFADASPPSEIRAAESGFDLAAKYASTFRERALPATREVEEPPGLCGRTK